MSHEETSYKIALEMCEKGEELDTPGFYIPPHTGASPALDQDADGNDSLDLLNARIDRLDGGNEQSSSILFFTQSDCKPIKIPIYKSEAKPHGPSPDPTLPKHTPLLPLSENEQNKTLSTQ